MAAGRAPRGPTGAGPGETGGARASPAPPGGRACARSSGPSASRRASRNACSAPVAPASTKRSAASSKLGPARGVPPHSRAAASCSPAAKRASASPTRTWSRCAWRARRGRAPSGAPPGRARATPRHRHAAAAHHGASGPEQRTEPGLPRPGAAARPPAQDGRAGGRRAAAGCTGSLDGARPAAEPGGGRRGDAASTGAAAACSRRDDRRGGGGRTCVRAWRAAAA